MLRKDIIRDNCENLGRLAVLGMVSITRSHAVRLDAEKLTGLSWWVNPPAGRSRGTVTQG